MATLLALAQRCKELPWGPRRVLDVSHTAVAVFSG